MLVYVLNKYGKPLMPCKPSKARKLLKEGKAKVVRKEPFTIQLLYGSSGYKQPITLGVDAGSKSIGLSATTENKELFAAEVEIRDDIPKLISQKRQYRKGRRFRKTRYRKPRFLNRVHSRKKQKQADATQPYGRQGNWLAPSVEHKIKSHIKLIDLVHSILPITTIVVEVASFDIQKIKNPNIEGKQYQQGEQLDFWNVREYVLWRDNYTCQRCKDKSKDKRLNVHHIESRQIGGNAPSNLITLCETCHKDYHDGKIKLDFKRGQKFKDATSMNIMRWTLYNRLKDLYSNVHLTYGYITKNTRIQNSLTKTHRIDALCISGHPQAKQLDYYYHIKEVRRHNRQIHKAKILKGGIRKLNQAPYLVHGFRLFDKVKYKGIECFIFGRRSTGYFDIRKLDGTVIHRSAKSKDLILVSKAKTLLWERRENSAFLSPLPYLP
ncbi:HNH endonuclease [Petrotoga mobilis SJ95]|uniref:HNH endonuclease n=1 Tax=Petrotoga mobilis (strain DSM 10674 / SJ95) TaxID=403833 RepID=A9BG24_PETMO|nr:MULTISPECIES: RNA-guided endonuclease IscB [Petrotoga]ABX31780.1 HNH endonuclease [Petrotoga mobilis SJ95]MBL5980791.1 HNH endonuclease [Petrotoga sp. 8T1HF07.NaAc.6.1]